MAEESSIFDLVITTDKDDYAPGETATFTLTGTTIGGTVEFQVLHVSDQGADGVYGTADDTLDAGPDGETGTADDGYGTTGEGHDAFTVTDGGEGDLDGEANGVIVTNWYVNPDDSLNETFLLTATETSTGAVATTSFTDAIQITYNQWSNFTSPEWQNGALNANQNRYFEGEYKPHVLEASGVQEGVTYVLWVAYDYSLEKNNGSYGGFDFFDEWDKTDFTPNQNPDPFPNPPGTDNLPIDPSTPTFENGGSLDAWNADILKIGTPIIYSGDGTGGNNDQTIRAVGIVFTPDDGDGTADEIIDVNLYWSLHLATPDAVAPGYDGAAEWDGASLRTILDVDAGASLSINTDGSAGAFDPNGGFDVEIDPTWENVTTGAVARSMATAGIVRGLISGYKWGDTDGDGIWDTDESGLAGWEITLTGTSQASGESVNLTVFTSDGTTDANGDGTINEEDVGYYEFSPLDRSTVDGYIITEVLQEGYEQTYPTAGTYTLVLSQDNFEYVGEFGVAEAPNFGNYQEPFPPSGTLDLEKYVSIDSGVTWVDADTATGPYLNSGTDPQFKFTVFNSSAVTAVDVVLTDNVFELDGLPGDAGGSGDGVYTISTIDSGGTFELIYTDASWQAGQHTNTGTIVYLTAGGGEASDTDDANYYGAAASIDVEKQVSIDGGTTWVDADTVTGPYLNSGTDPQFRFVVTNNGNVDLSNVTLSDSDFNIDTVNGDNTVDIGALAAGDTTTLVYTGAIWMAGQHTNTATASGDFTDGNGETDTQSDTDDANYYGAAASIDVEKQVSIDGGTTWVDADTVTGPYLNSGTDPQFRFVVTNNGNVDLSNVTLSDSDFNIDTVNGDNTVDIGALAAGDTTTLVYTGAIWMAGQHTNTATASGDFTDGNGETDTQSDTDDANYYGAAASIDVEKQVSIDGGTTWVDADTVTGPYLNSGTDPQFRFVVTNNGNVDLSNVTLSDSDFNIDTVNGDNTVDIGALAAGDTTTLVYTGAIWMAGQHTNTATASGDFTDGNGETDTQSDTDDANYYGAAASIDVEKQVSIDGGTTWVDADTVTGPYLNSGTDPQFRFVVTNNGNVDLSNVTLSDSDFNIDTVNGDNTVDIGALAAGDTTTLVYTGAIWMAGQHTNTATASGDFTDGNGETDTQSDTDDANYYGAAASIDVEKQVSIDGGTTWVDADTVTGPYLNSGTDPQFRFVVTNNGNVDLSNVTLSDSDFNIDTVNGDNTVDIGALAAGDTTTLVYTGAIWMAGQHTNTATASGDFTDGNGETDTQSDTDDANYYGAAASIDVEKQVSIDGGTTWVDADTVTGPYLNSGTDPQFRFVVTNNGNVDLSNVTLSDSDFNIDTVNGDNTVDIGALAAGDTTTLVYTGAIWMAGQHTNTATASGDFTDGNGETDTQSDTDDANYYGAAASIDVEKQVSIDGGTTWVDADTVTGPYLNSGTDPQFRFVVTNNGNVDLSNVTLSDSDFNIDTVNGDNTVDIGALAAGDTTTLVYTGAIWMAGQHTNTATASGDFTDGNGETDTQSDTDDANYYGAAASIDVEKQVSIDGGTTWVDADTVTGPYLNSGTDPQFRFVVTNNGNVDLSNVTLSDSDFNIDTVNGDNTVDIGALAAGDTTTLVYTGAIWMAGQHTNTATASGDFTDGNGETDTQSDTDDANYYGAAASIDVEKQVSIDGGTTWVDADTVTGPYLNSGTDPQFRFVVTNNGNVDLSNVTLSDSDFNIDTVNGDNTVDIGALAAGDTTTLVYTGAIWMAGQHTNTATASGDFTDGNGETDTQSDTDDANYYGAAASIDVEKQVSIDGGTTWVDADTVTGPYLNSGTDPQFRFVVTNNGNVDLSNVTLSDSDFNIDTVNGDNTVDIGALAAGDTTTLVYTGAIWMAGQHTNTATASGDFTDGNGETDTQSDTDDANYYGAAASIDVEKQVSIDGGTTWVDADTVTGPYLNSGTDPQFRFVVTNNGNVDLSNVTLSDSDFNIDTVNGDNTVDIGALAAGDTTTLVYTGAIWMAGQHTNTATASGDFTDGNGETDTQSDTDDANYYGAAASIDVEKQVSIDGGTTWVDADTVTGPYLNSGTDPQFRFVVTNNGNVDLSNVTLSDSDFNIDTVNGDNTVDIGALAAGDTTTLVYTGAIWMAGQHTNTATASGDFTDGNGETDTQSDTDDANYYGAAASIDVEKQVSIDGGTTWVDADTVTGPYLNSGTDPQFRFVVTNNGNVDLSNVTLSDSDFNIDTVNGDNTVDIGALAAGDTTTLVYTGAIWMAGQHTNTATASGDFTDGNGETDTQSDTDDANYYGAAASIDVEKQVSIDGGTTWVDADTVTGPYLNSGTDPQFRFVVTNNGNVDLSNVTLSDSDFNIDTVNGDNTVDIGALAAGDTTTLVYTGAIWMAGQHTNTATASGDFTDGNGETDTQSDTDDANYYGAAASIDVEKQVSIDGGTTWVDADTVTGPYLNSGTDPQFRFVVTNNGNVDLSNVTLSDSDFNIDTVNGDNTVDIGALAAGDTTTLVYTGAIWMAGQHTNTATASGDFTDGNGETDTQSDTDDANYYGAAASIDVEKQVSIDGGTTWVDADTVTGPYLNSGTDPQFRFVVTNNGNVDLSNVTLSDSDFNIDTVNGDNTVDIGALAAGDTTTLVYTGAIWMAGQHTNTATASGDFTDGNGETDTQSDTDDANYYGTDPSIAIIKTTSDDYGNEGDGIGIIPGENVTWKYYVTSTGNVALTNVQVSDDQGVTPTYVSGDSDNDGWLDIDETIDGVDTDGDGKLDTAAENWLYTASGIAQPNEATGGWYNNTGTATGDFTDDGGNTETATASDDSSYYALEPGYVTNSSLCDFGDQFNLVFTPDLKNWDSTPAYKLSDSNPGQFYYNLFYIAGEETETVTIDIPYPFVTQGATPVHAYSGVTVGDDGTVCFDPGTEIFNGQLTYDLDTTEYNDLNNSGRFDYGDTYTMTVSGLPTEGFVYLNLHMDYGLEKTDGWDRSGGDAINDPVVNGDLAGVDILNMTDHTFDSSIDDSADTIANNNDFKTIKGFGGLVEIQVDVDGELETQGVADAVVEIYKGTTFLDTATTDENGWYFMENYQHKGKQTDYTVKLLADINDGNSDGITYDAEELITTVGRGDKFGEGYFLVENTFVPTSPLNVVEGPNTGEQSGADLTQAMLAPVVAAAVDYWAEQGVDAEALDSLLKTDIRIEDLGGSRLGEATDQLVTLDDDAAGYGWSDSLSDVDADEIDLLSVVTHEFGHLLGYEHDVMGDTLAAGERDLPFDDQADDDDQSVLGMGVEGDLLFG